MADISFGIDSNPAKAGAKDLDRMLSQLETKAIGLQKRLDNLTVRQADIKSRLTVTGLRGNIASIQREVTAYTKGKPVRIHAALHVTKQNIAAVKRQISSIVDTMIMNEVRKAAGAPPIPLMPGGKAQTAAQAVQSMGITAKKSKKAWSITDDWENDPELRAIDQGASRIGQTMVQERVQKAAGTYKHPEPWTVSEAALEDKGTSERNKRALEKYTRSVAKETDKGLSEAWEKVIAMRRSNRGTDLSAKAREAFQEKLFKTWAYARVYSAENMRAQAPARKEMEPMAQVFQKVSDRARENQRIMNELGDTYQDTTELTRRLNSMSKTAMFGESEKAKLRKQLGVAPAKVTAPGMSPAARQEAIAGRAITTMRHEEIKSIFAKALKAIGEDESGSILSKTKRAYQKQDILAAQEQMKVLGGKVEKGGLGLFDEKNKAELDEISRQYAALEKKALGYEKATKKLEERHKRLGNSVGFAGSKFAKFSIIMSGIAATLFVWQELSRAIVTAIRTGWEFVAMATSLSAASGYSADNLIALNHQVESVARNLGATPKESSAALKALEDLGLGPAEQMKYLHDTLLMVKSGTIEVGDAAKLASRGASQLKEKFLEAGRKMDDTAQGALARFKGQWSLLMKSFYTKMEPAFIEGLEKLSQWVDRNGPAIVEFGKTMTQALMAIGEAALDLMGKVAWIPGWVADISKAAGLVAGGLLTKQELAIVNDPKDLNTLVEGLVEPEKHLKALGNLKAKLVAEYRSLMPEMERLRKKYENQAAGTGPSMIDDMTISKFKLLESLIGKVTNAMVKGQDKVAKGMNDNAGKPLVNLENMAKSWNDVFSTVGAMSDEMFLLMAANIQEQARVITRDLGGAWGALYEKVKMFELEQQRLSGKMKAGKELFDMTGDPQQISASKYFDNEIRRIEHEMSMIRSLGLLSKSEADLMEAMKRRGVEARKIKPRMENESQVFDTTGSGSDWYETQRRKKIQSQTRAMRSTHVAEIEISRWAMAEHLKLSEELMQKRLEDEREFFDTSGLATRQYIEMERRLLNNRLINWIYSGMPKTDAVRLYKEQLSALENSFIEPQIEAYEDLHATTGRMDTAHFELAKANLDKWLAHTEQITGNTKRTLEAYYKKLDELEADFLEGSDQFVDGREAGLIRIEQRVETHAKVVSDSMVNLADDLDQSFKQGFFDVMEMRFNTMEDVAINVFRSIAKAANDILYDALKNTLKGSMGGDSSSSIFGLISSGVTSLFGSKTAAPTAGSGPTDVSNMLAKTGGTGASRLDKLMGLDSGGWLMEPVIGVGQRSGSIYTIAEKNPEFVANPRLGQVSRGDTAGGGNLTISVPVNVAGPGSGRLAAEIQSGVERTVLDILRREMR